ncbi:MAG: hypothetical protein GKR94_11410 [Gammaproteobacteria bacterium]|nr:hypothetical protein [Gammaproteobacteria bacterium]
MTIDIRRVDEELRLRPWPRLTQSIPETLGEGDHLVLCAGFEDRAEHFLNTLVEGGHRGFSATILDYRPFYPENKTQRLVELVSAVDGRVGVEVYDRARPAGIAQQILEKFEPGVRVFLDVSAMSRLLIVQLVSACVQDTRVRELHVVYAEAESYPPNKEDVERALGRSERPSRIGGFLSKGILDIVTAPELSSVAMAGEASRLVAFPSFEAHQLSSLLAELQPSHLHVLEGVPPRPEFAWRTVAIRDINKPSCRIVGISESVAVSTLDYRETIAAIIEIYDRHSVFDRIVVSPTGSKMQSVAVGVVRAALDDIQVIYPTAHEFLQPTEHTTGVRSLHHVSLPVQELRALLGEA